MPYSCEDIQHILNYDLDDPICEKSFSRHLENCRTCRNLCELEPELEDLLQMSLPKAVPISLADEVTAKISIYEKIPILNRMIDKFLAVGAVSVVAIIMAIIIGKWGELTTVFSSIRPGSIVNRIVLFWHSVEPPEIGLSQLISDVINSPVVLMGLIGATALLWAYSILEFEKSPR